MLRIQARQSALKSNNSIFFGKRTEFLRQVGRCTHYYIRAHARAREACQQSVVTMICRDVYVGFGRIDIDCFAMRALCFQELNA